MNKSLLVVSVLMLGMAGCTTIRVGPTVPIQVGEKTVDVPTGGYNVNAVTKYDGNMPNIIIAPQKEQIVIDQEPVRPLAQYGSGRSLILWALASGSPYSFPDDKAIIIHGDRENPLPKDLKCATLGEGRKIFYCLYTYERPVKWKYSVTVRNDATGKELQRLDPIIMSD